MHFGLEQGNVLWEVMRGVSFAAYNMWSMFQSRHATKSINRPDKYTFCQTLTHGHYRYL
jgi:hypothetical protein